MNSLKGMETPAMMPHTQAAINAMRPLSDAGSQPTSTTYSSARLPYPSGIPASPSRLRSSSPRFHSPASSEIFERSVQEPVPMSTLPADESAHIPSHVMTEDHIPAALEAAVEAITSENLNADEVEIVTSTAHQTAAASVLESSASHADLSQLGSSSLRRHRSDDAEFPHSIYQSGHIGTDEEGAGSYGQLDPNDVRRVSFISFADVQNEQHQQQQMGSHFGDAGSRDSLHMSSHKPTALGSAPDRAASPLRSPRSPSSSYSHSFSGGVTTPPPGLNVPSHEQSPPRGAPSTGGSQHGELKIETMRQALRKTASGDLSGTRAAGGMSPTSIDDNSLRETRSRTDT